MRTVLALAAATLSLGLFTSTVEAQHSATWKARGLPRTVVPAANYIGRSNADGGMLNYSTFRPYNVAGYSDARYNRAPYNPYFAPAPAYESFAAADRMDERRTMSYQPGDDMPPDQMPPDKGGNFQGPMQGPMQAPPQK